MPDRNQPDTTAMLHWGWLQLKLDLYFPLVFWLVLLNISFSVYHECSAYQSCKLFGLKGSCMNKWWRLSFHIGGSFSQCFFPPNYSLLEFLPAFKGHSSLQCHHSLIALTNSELALSLFQNAHCLETSSAMAIWLVTENHAMITLALFKLRWANISTQNLLNSYTIKLHLHLIADSRDFCSS